MAVLFIAAGTILIGSFFTFVMEASNKATQQDTSSLWIAGWICFPFGIISFISAFFYLRREDAKQEQERNNREAQEKESEKREKARRNAEREEHNLFMSMYSLHHHDEHITDDDG